MRRPIPNATWATSPISEASCQSVTYCRTALDSEARTWRYCFQVSEVERQHRRAENSGIGCTKQPEMALDTEDSMELRRAVITGLGTVNPLANNVADFWAAACRGQSGVGYISHFDAGAFRTRIGAEVKDFRPDALLGARQAKRLDRYAQFALAAAMEASTESGI